MPVRCSECPCFDQEVGFCNASQISAPGYDQLRPDYCPLIIEEQTKTIKTYRELQKERAIAISNAVNETTEAIKEARAKSDYKTVADLTNTLVALLTVAKE